ncbi:MAG: nucleotide triphosphate diphosphatase NUDT15 [Bacillota bacterium]
MSEEAKQRPLVAVGIIVRNKEGKILLGERLASHGAGMYQTPGGHLEYGKTFEQAARDEVAEETGLTDLTFVRMFCINNERVFDKHYVNIGFLVDCNSGEPTNPEPEKSRNWTWYDPHDIPEPTFPPSRGIIDSWLSGTFTNDIVSGA